MINFNYIYQTLNVSPYTKFPIHLSFNLLLYNNKNE